MDNAISPQVASAAIEELRSIQADACRDTPTEELKTIGNWIRDRLSYVIVMLEYGDKG